MSLRELGSTDAADALPWLWRIGAGIGLIVMVGSWVNKERPARPNVRVEVAQSVFRRDSISGAARVEIRVEARRGLRLAGCPAPPVLVLQRRAENRWINHQQINRPCTPQTPEQRVDLGKGQAVTTVLPVTVPGRYRVGASSGSGKRIRWVVGEQFTVL